MKSTMWTYPWDVLDIGTETVLDDILDRAGVTGVSLATSYHAGRFLGPRNPRRRVYFPEDGTLYFRADPRRYERLKLQPRVASIVTEEGDALAALADARQKRAFTLNGWTVCLHNTRLGVEHPDACTENAYGDKNFYNLCPSNPDARAYLRAVVSDLTDHYELDSIELESPNFLGFAHEFHHEKDGVGLTSRDDYLLSLCFCPSCLAGARKAGVNGEEARRQVRQLLDETLTRPVPVPTPTFVLDGPETFVDYPELLAYIRWRTTPVTSLITEVREAANDATKVYFLSLETKGAWLLGVDFKAVGGACDGIVLCAYDVPPEQVADEVARARTLLPENEYLSVGLRIFYPEVRGPDELAAKVAAAHPYSPDGFNFYNYGLIPRARLDWIRRSLEATGTPIAPT
jgi:hypothetical protein